MITENQKQQIKMLYAHGKDCKEIADILKVSYRQVYYCCTKENDVCLQCGKPIKQHPHRKKKLFCCDKCRITWWNHNKSANRSLPSHTQVCKSCRQTFHTYKSKHQQYCSRKCYADARRKG